MQKNRLKKALFGACLLFLTGNLAAQFNQFNFTYGTGLTTTATTISFGYNLNVTTQVPDPNHSGSGGNLFGRVFLDGGAAGNYFVGEFHHKYSWSIVSVNTSLNTINLYTAGYPTISGNPLAEQYPPAVTNVVSTTPSVTLNVPTGCIPNGTYNIRVDMYSFSAPPSEFPNGATTKFTIGSTVTYPTMLNFGWAVLAGYAGSGNIGTYTVSSGSGLSASAAITSGTCTSNGSVAVTPSGGTSPYTLYYKKLNGTANTAGSGSSTITATNLQAGATYDIAIVDANGCRWEDRIVMPVPAPTVSATPASQTVCKGTCVTFAASASPGTGYSYSWTHSNSNTPTHQISTANYFCTTVPGITNQSSTVNTYIVTATNGYCTGTATRIMTTNNSCIPAMGSCCNPPPRSPEAGNNGDGNVYLEVYPNPTSGTLTVSFEGLDRTGVVAEIFDATGKRMLAENVTDGSSRIDLNVSELPSGVYIVRFVANGEQLMSRSFVRE